MNLSYVNYHELKKDKRFYEKIIAYRKKMCYNIFVL